MNVGNILTVTLDVLVTPLSVQDAVYTVFLFTVTDLVPLMSVLPSAFAPVQPSVPVKVQLSAFPPSQLSATLEPFLTEVLPDIPFAVITTLF